MPKDDRKINSAIRLPRGEDGQRRTFGDGDEDELAAALPQERLDALVKGGQLSGTWKATKAEGKAAKK